MRMLAVFLAFLTALASPFAAHASPVFSVKKTSVVKYVFDPFNRLKEYRVEAEITVKSNFSRELCLTVVDSAAVSAETVSPQEDTPLPEVRAVAPGLTMLIWRGVRVPPRSEVKLKYDGTPVGERLFRVVRRIYVNGEPATLVKLGNMYKVKVKPGDLVTVSVRIVNLAPRLFTGAVYLKPLLQVKVMMDLNDELFEITDSSIEPSSGPMGGSSWAFTVMDEAVFNVTIMVKKLGSWGEVELPRMKMYVNPVGSLSQANMYISQAESLRRYAVALGAVEDGLRSLQSSLANISYALANTTRAFSTKESLMLIDALEESVLSSLDRYYERLVEMEQDLNEAVINGSLRKGPVSRLNEAIQDMKSQVEEAKDSVEDVFSSLRKIVESGSESLEKRMGGLYQALAMASEAIGRLADMVGVLKVAMEAEASMYESYARLLEYVYYEYYMPQTWACLGEPGRGYSLAEKSRLEGAIWSVDAVRFRPVHYTAGLSKYYVRYLVVSPVGETCEILSVEPVSEVGRGPVNASSLGLRRHRGLLVIPVYTVSEEPVINVLKHPLIGNLKLFVADHCEEPRLNLTVVYLVQPGYSELKDEEMYYEVSFAEPVLSEFAAFEEPGGALAAGRRVPLKALYLLIAAVVMLVAVMLFFQARRIGKGPREDVELNSVIKKLRQLEELLKRSEKKNE